MLKSLRWRLQFWHSALLALVVIGFASALYLQQRWSRLRQIDDELSAALLVLEGQLRSVSSDGLEGQLSGAGDPGARVTQLVMPDTFAPRRVKHTFENPYFVIWDSRGRVLATSSESASDTFRPSTNTPQLAGSRSSTRFYSTRDRDGYRETFLLGPAGTTILTGRFIEPDLRDIRQFLWVLIATAIGLFLVGLVGGYWLARYAVRPIEKISGVAAKISEENLSERVDPSAMPREFALLSKTLNKTLDRLESSFDRQKQFTSDASHELRTPLSILQTTLDLALSKSRSTQEYEQMLQTCGRATRRMSSLVADLLQQARLDANVEIKFTEIDVPLLLRTAIDQVRVLAAEKEVELNLQSEACKVFGDHSLLLRALVNLLTNAIAYSDEGKLVHVSATHTEGVVSMVVEDQGIGIAQEDLPKLFRRFYRCNQSRDRDSGGSGLGLSICDTIVKAHGGVLSVESKLGVGSRFSFELPVENVND